MEFLQNDRDIIILILFSILGFGIIIYNIILIKKGHETLNWIEVKGLITKSELGILRQSGQTSLDYCYRADIEYDFEVIDKNFHSRQAFLGDKIYTSGKSKAKTTLKMFPVNHAVSVFVNPDNYSESVLIRGSGANRFLNIAIGLILVIIGILVKTNFELILNTFKGLEK
jgi:hypothetical protein